MNTAPAACARDDNPFFEDWSEPYGVPPFARIKPEHFLPAFERACAAFRQQPDTERLGHVQLQCSHLVAAMASTPTTKEKVRAIECDPKISPGSAS